MIKDRITLDEAHIVQAAAGQQCRSIADNLIPLDFLLADIQQSDARPGDVLDAFHDNGAHDRELEQVLRRTVGIGAKIEHVTPAGLGWHQRHNRGAVDARQGLEHEPCGRHQRAGVSGAYTGFRLALLDEVDGDSHRGIFLLTQRITWRLVHRNHFARVLDKQTLTQMG